MREKIIIDTDIGDDIDDALAISLALKSPELDLIGITTVFKNSALRAKLAKKLLNIAGKPDIPVFSGCGQPIVNRVNTNEIFCQFTEDIESLIYNTEMHAVDFIIDQAAKSDNDLVLVPIGPLTNIGMAVVKEPDIMKKVKKIVLMGGAFYMHCNEWNILCDPEAAKIVFDSGIPIEAIGLDVTLKCRLSESHLETIFHRKGEWPEFLAGLIKLWSKVSEGTPYLHDPLAVCSLFARDIVQLKNIKVEVETRGEFCRGTTFNITSNEWWKSSKCQSSVWAADEVDSEKFLSLFMERLFT